MAIPSGSSAVACALSGWANMLTSTMTVPNSSTAEAKPAAACNMNGPTVFLHARFMAWKAVWRRRARSWLMATRMRSSRSSGSGTGPSAASEACIFSRDLQSSAHAWHCFMWAATLCISRPLRRPSRYSVNFICIALQSFIAPPHPGQYRIPHARENRLPHTQENHLFPPEPSESPSRRRVRAPAAI